MEILLIIMWFVQNLSLMIIIVQGNTIKLPEEVGIIQRIIHTSTIQVKLPESFMDHKKTKKKLTY